MFDLMPFGKKQGNLFNYFDDLEKQFFGEMRPLTSTFKSDIIDKGDQYILQAELPGFAKEDININIEGNYITISASHNEEVNEDKENYVRRERRYGCFTRSFDISDIKSEEIQAEYKDGVLELSLPKKNTTKNMNARKIEIK